MFSDVNWIKSSFSKLDKPLRRELLNCYRHTKVIPCFLKDWLNKFRYNFRKIKVIIKYHDNCYTDDKAVIRNLIKFKENRKNIDIRMLNCYSTKISPKKINQLLQLNQVKSIYLDRDVKALLNTACPTINAPYAWETGKTGKGVTLAVIDTGIHPHEDLITPTNRIIGFRDFINNKIQPYDDNGHGTHVTGDMAGNGQKSNGLYKGPAYESHLVGVKVLDNTGSGSLSNVIAGVQWCVENKEQYGIRIIGMSLGAKAEVSYKEDLLCQAVKAAWNAGIVVCAAAGNEGPESGTISSPGIDPKIITVGAADDKDTIDKSGDVVADYSSRGPTMDGINKPDVVCPGTNIISLRVPSSYLDKQMKSSRIGEYYFNMSGTSMATPICCGVIALLLESNPSLQPDQVKTLLMETSGDMGFDRNAQGTGCVDVKNALSRLLPNA